MDEAEPSIRDHLERLLPPGGRARQLLGWGVVAWSAIGAILVIGALVRLVERFASIFPYLAVAAVVVFVLNPAVKALVSRGVPRRLAATLVFAGAAALTAALLSFAVPVVIHQAQTLGRQSGGLVRKGGSLFDGLVCSHNSFFW